MLPDILALAKFYWPIHIPYDVLCDGYNMSEERFSFMYNWSANQRNYFSSC